MRPPAALRATRDHLAWWREGVFSSGRATLRRLERRGDIDDDQWFAGMAAIFDAAYPAGDDPRAQSGFGGDEARWEAARRPIAEQIDREGAFLDIGCANGYLMESIVRWAEHQIEPHGLDLVAAVVELARRQRPRWGDRIPRQRAHLGTADAV